ncbi:MAG TPA: dodecin domain-containing protein [Hellea balneolensis]|uniref:Dodecin domain-containing protein n=1 Tax=Hellea balneolensis TaxID=287478 RepID=A0A7V5NXB8_9PROT|nr:dodecin domain-containing protein [Hellea balneolensis]
MAIMKSVQIMSESEKSFEDAIANAVERMTDSVDHVRSANVNNQSVTVKGGKIDKYRVNLQITFEVKK